MSDIDSLSEQLSAWQAEVEREVERVDAALSVWQLPVQVYPALLTPVRVPLVPIVQAVETLIHAEVAQTAELVRQFSAELQQLMDSSAPLAGFVHAAEVHSKVVSFPAVVMGAFERDLARMRDTMARVSGPGTPAYDLHAAMTLAHPDRDAALERIAWGIGRRWRLYPPARRALARRVAERQAHGEQVGWETVKAEVIMTALLIVLGERESEPAGRRFGAYWPKAAADSQLAAILSGLTKTPSHLDWRRFVRWVIDTTRYIADGELKEEEGPQVNRQRTIHEEEASSARGPVVPSDPLMVLLEREEREERHKQAHVALQTLMEQATPIQREYLTALLAQSGDTPAAMKAMGLSPAYVRKLRERWRAYLSA